MGKNGLSGLDFYYNSSLFGNGQFSRSPGAQRERAIQAMLERNIAELALNRFKYENLPDSVDPRFLEIALLFNGLAVWYWDNDFDKLIAVNGTGTGYMNYLQHPVSYTVIGPGAKILYGDNASGSFAPKTLSAYLPEAHAELDDSIRRKKAIPMWPNYLRMPDIDIVNIYSSKLATIDRTLEINTKNARRNKVITVNANNQLSIENISRQMDEGVEQISVKGAANPEAVINAIDLGILPDSYEKLSILRTRWWNDCMGLLGIDNANQDKKERLVKAEVGANDAQTDSMRFVALNARKEAIKHINDVFGENISVEFNTEVEAMAKDAANVNGINSEDGE
jgi:hypothetical protein